MENPAHFCMEINTCSNKPIHLSRPAPDLNLRSRIMKYRKSHNLTGYEDIIRTLADFRLALLLGWLDVAQRYRRSIIGPFWLTINMGVLICSLGLVFGNLFGTPMSEFLPFICVGMIVWGYCTQLINEGCISFINNSETILQLPIPLFTYVMRTWWRNTVILFHNMIIFPLTLLVFFKFVNFSAFLAVPGLIILSLNLLWVATILAVLCTRYRDLTLIVQNIMQVLLYLTPIMWMPTHMPDGAPKLILDFNPFYHLISIVRDPLLGNTGTEANWIVSIAMAIIGWTITINFLGRNRHKIAYWL